MSHPTHRSIAESLADYLQAMKRCRQFTYINIEPAWVPASGDIDGFIQDEVVRQGHDPRKEYDGGVRVRGMKSAWWYAQTQSGQGGGPVVGVAPPEPRPPGMDDILAIGTYIEPTVNNTTGFRYQNVYIGDSTGAPPNLINEMVVLLCQTVQKVEPTTGREGPHAEEYRNLWKWLPSDRYAGKDAITRIVPGYDYDRHKVLMAKFAELTHDIVTADDWYMCFEAIHPFGDGNGRSGKTLHNWLLGTLNDPVLVDDYFGGGNP